MSVAECKYFIENLIRTIQEFHDNPNSYHELFYIAVVFILEIFAGR